MADIGVFVPRFGDGRRMRIGVLGGSFNPAHEGHCQLAQYAMRVLHLDQVWLMVSPGNPLKLRRGMAPFGVRLESARRIADGRRIVATDIEKRLGQCYSVKTIMLLKQRFPYARFVWLMGADGLVQFSRWKNWQRLAQLVPLVVFPRPGSVMSALHSRAASVLRHERYLPRQAALLLKNAEGRGWTFLSTRQNAISATTLRESGQFCSAIDQE